MQKFRNLSRGIAAILFSKSDVILEGCADLRVEAVKARIASGLRRRWNVTDARRIRGGENVPFTRKHHDRMSSQAATFSNVLKLEALNELRRIALP